MIRKFNSSGVGVLWIDRLHLLGYVPLGLWNITRCLLQRRR